MPLYIELVLALQYEYQLLNRTLSGPLMIMIFRDSSNIGVPKYPSDISKLNECSFTVLLTRGYAVRSQWYSAQDAKSGSCHRPVKLYIPDFIFYCDYKEHRMIIWLAFYMNTMSYQVVFIVDLYSYRLSINGTGRAVPIILFFYLLFYSEFPPKCSYYSQGLPYYSQL